MWKGIGYNIDSAFQYRDGKTYFFKGKGYWRFNDLRMSVDHADPLLSAHEWMKCQRLPKQREPIVDVTTEEQQQVSGATGVTNAGWPLALFILLALVSSKTTLLSVVH